MKRYEVQIPDPGDLRRTYDEIDWLTEQGLMSHRDWSIDMHGGSAGYTSFFFKSLDNALMFKLTRGGV